MEVGDQKMVLVVFAFLSNIGQTGRKDLGVHDAVVSGKVVL
jgi:hypothetical protein